MELCIPNCTHSRFKITLLQHSIESKAISHHQISTSWHSISQDEEERVKFCCDCFSITSEWKCWESEMRSRANGMTSPCFTSRTCALGREQHILTICMDNEYLWCAKEKTKMLKVLITFHTLLSDLIPSPSPSVSPTFIFHFHLPLMAIALLCPLLSQCNFQLDGLSWGLWVRSLPQTDSFDVFCGCVCVQMENIYRPSHFFEEI